MRTSAPTAVSGIFCTLHGVRLILFSLRGHNSIWRVGVGMGGTAGTGASPQVGGKCCLTQLPFWSGPELPASQMAQPKSEDEGQASCSSPTHPAAASPPLPHLAEDIQLLVCPRALTSIPWLLTVLLLPAPPRALEELARKFLARRRLQLLPELPELPSCRRALRLRVSRLAPQCHMVSEGIGLVRK